MNKPTYDWVDSIMHYLPAGKKVLELGSLNVNGGVRELFKIGMFQYLGIDLREGQDVDLIMDANEIGDKFKESEFDIVIALSLFEHDKYWWRTLEGVNKVLKQDGYFVFSVPTFYFPIHRHPKDYYRFGEDAVREVFFEGFEILAYEEIYVDEANGKLINPIINCLGRKL